MEEKERKPSFGIALQTRDPLSLLMQQIFDLRVEVGVLSALVMDALVASGKGAEEVAERYRQMRHQLSLDLAFELQDTHQEKPQSPDSSGSS